MELVKGVPITQFCDERRLTPRERLELAIPVCQAVQHAHQKGVIHRDLKPSNILVGLYDGVPVPKVIDFGVAKATGPKLTEATLFTGFGAVVGTPEYMSPEQAQLDNLDIDTRCDVYSLGVLLYELLTGTTPLDRKRLKETAILEILRVIREKEPPRPSMRLSTTEELPSIAACRSVEPRRLSSLVRGELDWIVMKALEKDRNRRYATVSGLAADLRRYLDDEPVQACPPSAWYRFRKFARRHRAGLAMAGLILSVLVLLGGGAGWVVRDRAARLTMTEQEVIRALGEATTLQVQSKWAESLEAAKRAEGFLAVSGSETLRQRVRELQNNLDMVRRLEDIRLRNPVEGTEGGSDAKRQDALYAQAFREYGVDVELLEPSEAARRVRAPSIRLELISALDHWAQLRRDVLEAADTSWKRLIAVAQAADSDAWRNEVRGALERGDHEKLTRLAASVPIGDLRHQTLCLFYWALDLRDDWRTFQSLLLRAQREHPDDFWINFDLAYAVDFGQQRDEAIRFYTAALSIRPGHTATACLLGRALHRQGRLDEAIALYRKTIESNPRSVYAYWGHAEALEAQGKLDEAIALLREASESRPDDTDFLNELAWRLATCHRPELRLPSRAIELGKKAVALAPRQATYWRTLGVAEYRAGHWIDAVGALTESMSLLGGDELNIGMSPNGFFLAMAHWQLGHKDEARKWYDQSVQWMKDDSPDDQQIRRFRAEAATLLGLPAPAAPARKEVPHAVND
jgi:tetratricopeptide (TPR) repeat protein